MVDLKSFESKFLTEEDEWRVIGWLALKGSSWTNEIAETMEYDIETAKGLVRNLIKKNWIFRITIDENNPHVLVMCRLSELHSKGITQMKQFQQRNFYGLTLEGFEAYQKKFRGQKKRAKNAYIQYLNLMPLENDTLK